MTEINSYRGYIGFGNYCLSRYGQDLNGDRQLDRNEVLPEYVDQFDCIAGIDSDSTSISFYDALVEEGYTLSPELERQLETVGETGLYTAADDPLFGSRADRTDAFLSFMRNHDYYVAFYEDVYRGTHSEGNIAASVMIPLQFRESASRLVEPYYEQFLRQIGRTEQNAFVSCYSYGCSEAHYIDPGDLSLGRSLLLVEVEEGGMVIEYEGYSYYLPPQVGALHEFGHVAAASVEVSYDIPLVPRLYAEEIVNRCEDILLQDDIMRQIAREQGQAVLDDQPLVYPLGIVTPHGTIPLGEFAVRLRSLVRQYGNTEAALMSQEFQDYIRPYYLPVADH